MGGHRSVLFRFSFARAITKVNAAGWSKWAQNDIIADFQRFIYFTNDKSEWFGEKFVALYIV